MEWTAPHPRRCPYPAEIEEARRKTEELDLQIANITNQINELTKIQLSLERERSNYQSFIAPFNRMPTEIICEIARHAVRQSTSPLALSRICGHMRDAVMGFKALWNHIFVTYHSSWKREHDGEIKCKNRQWLQVVLQRASPSSLFIRIIAPGEMAEMLEALIPFTPYIDTIEIEDYDGLKPIPLIQLSAMNFSGLRSFSYRTSNRDPIGLVNILDAIKRSCHRQFTLKLDLKHVAFYPALAHSIIGNVSKLILAPDYNRLPSGPSEVLRLCTMPHLQSLETYGVPCLFTASSLSSLTHLVLQDGFVWERINIEDIPCGIQSLTIHGYGIGQQHKDSVSVSRFPDLRHIKFIEAIMRVRGGCILAPRLEWLEVIHDRHNLHRKFSTHFRDHFINGALFGSHSLCRLRLDGFTITGSSVQNMKSLGTCQDLGLINCQVSNGFVIGLSSSPESPDALFPILENLHVPSTRDESKRPLYGLLKESAMNRPLLKMTQ